MTNESFGAMFRRLRIESGQTLRAFCLANSLDPGNISKLERGRMAVPDSDEIIEQYANALGLKPGSSKWTAFTDLASAAKGQIPTDLLNDPEIVDRLPVLFRVLRGTNSDDQALQDLVDKIRSA